MEWSTTRLGPALYHSLVGGRGGNTNACDVLAQLLKTLNDTLSRSLCVTGPQITAADIAIWSLLAADGTLKNAQNIDSVLIWHNQMAKRDEVQVFLSY